MPRVVSTIGPPSLTNLGTELVLPSGRAPAASLPPRAFAMPATNRTSTNMLASTPVSTRDGVIRRVRTGYGTTGAAGGTAAVVFGALDADGARVFLVGFADAVGANVAEAAAVGVAVTGSGWRVTGTGAGTTGRGRTGATAGAGVFDGRSGVTCCTVVDSAPGAALAAGRAEGDAVTLTSTIARYATHEAAAR